MISLSVPDSIISHYQNTENSYIKRLIFNNNNVEQPVLNELAIDFKCEFNILYGSIFEFQDNIVGNLIVKFDLDATKYVRLENVLKEKNILLKELSL